MSWEISLVPQYAFMALTETYLPFLPLRNQCIKYHTKTHRPRNLLSLTSDWTVGVILAKCCAMFDGRNHVFPSRNIHSVDAIERLSQFDARKSLGFMGMMTRRLLSRRRLGSWLRDGNRINYKSWCSAAAPCVSTSRLNTSVVYKPRRIINTPEVSLAMIFRTRDYAQKIGLDTFVYSKSSGSSGCTDGPFQ
jgi:hypothetical protein